MKPREHFMVFDARGRPVQVETDLDEAIAVANDVALRAGKTRLYVEASDSCAAVRTNPPEAMPELAFKATSLPTVTAAQLKKVDLEKAWATLRPLLDPKGKMKAYSTPENMAKAFIGQNYKTSKKVEGFDGKVMGLSLTPYYKGTAPLYSIKKTTPESRPKGVPTLCFGSNPQCRAACLVTTGRNIGYAVEIKYRRTEALYKHSVEFSALLSAGIGRFERASLARGVEPFVRLNVYSDIPWELFCPDLFALHPGVQFYDYTKIAMRNTPENYDLTFSFSGTNWDLCERELARGRRIAVVFAPTWKGGRLGQALKGQTQELPPEFAGYSVVDGDDSDLRPLDPGDCVVGLRFKAPKTEDTKLDDLGSFVVRVWQPEDGIFVAAHSARQSGAADFREAKS